MVLLLLLFSWLGVLAAELAIWLIMCIGFSFISYFIEYFNRIAARAYVCVRGCISLPWLLLASCARIVILLLKWNRVRLKHYTEHRAASICAL